MQHAQAASSSQTTEAQTLTLCEGQVVLWVSCGCPLPSTADGVCEQQHQNQCLKHKQQTMALHSCCPRYTQGSQ